MSFKKHPEELRLWSVIDDQTASERERGEAFSELAQAKVVHQEYDQAISLAEQAERIFTKIRDEKNVADAIYTQGNAYFGNEDYAAALERFERSAQIFRADTNETFLAFAVDRSGDCYQELRQHSLAAQSYQSAAALFASVDNKVHAADSILDAANELIRLGEFEQAEFAARRAFDYLETISTTEIMMRCFATWSHAFFLQGLVDQAIDKRLEAININSYLDDIMALSENYLMLAGYHKQAGQFDEAKGAISQARLFSEELANPSFAARCDLAEAEVLFDEGQLDFAIMLATKCRYAVSFENRHAAFHAEYLLGRISAATSDTGKAIEYFENAINHLKHFPERDFEDETVFVDLASALITTPNIAKVIEVLDELPSVETLKPAEQVRSHNLRARAHYLLSHHQRAIEVTDQVFGLTGEDWSDFNYAYALETKARALLDSGETNEGRACLQHAINVFASQGQPNAAYLATTLKELAFDK